MDSVFIKKNVGWQSDSLIYQIDTILFKSEMYRNILTGTAIIPNTQNQRNAIGYGVELVNVSFLDCDNEKNPYQGQNKIKSVIKTDSTIQIDCEIFDNCCYSFLCDIKVDSSRTLDLLYMGYGNYCACDCCFGLTFYLKRPDYIDKIDIESITINGNTETKRLVE